MPMFVHCSECGRRADAFDGTMNRGFDGWDNTGRWHCGLPRREACRARKVENETKARVEKKARLARMADERRA